MVEISEISTAPKAPEIPNNEHADNLSTVMDGYKDKSFDEMAKDMNSHPFFMTQLEDDADNTPLQALKALAFEGTSDEVAENFRQQGNEYFRSKQYKDAAHCYTQAIDQDSGVATIEIACYGNRAQCNLELRNYRSCVNDCIKVLEIDHDNLKAWYRSAKAFQSLDRLDESLTCCTHGLSVDPDNVAIKNVRDAVLKRKQQLQQLDENRKIREAEKQEKNRIFTLALDQRNITKMFTEKNKNHRSNAGDLAPELEDPKDQSSELFVPILFLYATAMESDIFQKVSEYSTIAELVEQLFEQPPAWSAKYPNYKLGNLDVFAPTSSGGLAKVGLKSTINKFLGTKQPDITMVDNMGRLFLVPKQDTKHWLENWPKSKQSLYP